MCATPPTAAAATAAAARLLFHAACLLAGDLVSTATYTCDPSTCVPPGCMCAANNPPGGLSSAQMPQFILVRVAFQMHCTSSATALSIGRQLLHALPHLLSHVLQLSHDNALNVNAFNLSQELYGGLKQRNNCPVPLTW